MEAWEIVKLVGSIAGVLFTVLIPSLILLIHKWKAFRAAKTEAEKQAAYNDLLGTVNGFIQDAEAAYKEVDTILKSQQKAGSGAVKKDSVMTKVQALCIEKGLSFDTEYWSKKIDELVEMTRKVNAKK